MWFYYALGDVGARMISWNLTGQETGLMEMMPWNW